jgi:hypothetical protein
VRDQRALTAALFATAPRSVRRRLGAEANSAKATSPHLAEAKAEADAAAAAAKPDAAHHKHGEGHGDGHGDGHGHGSAEQEYVAEPFYGEVCRVARARVRHWVRGAHVDACRTRIKTGGGPC